MRNPIRHIMSCVLLLCSLFLITGCDPATEQTEDGSVWENVIIPGFGNLHNSGIVAMAEYKGQLYAMTRNEVQGSEIWRTTLDGSWEQVLFPGGETNGVYRNPWLTSLWGSMVVFQDKLYCGFSSGHQAMVYDSTGCEIWRFDGSDWEPVISDRKDTEESGIITNISGCQADDGDTTALITDFSKAWVENQWAGGVLQITSGDGRFRRFDIVSNTENTLVIQQNEIANNRQEFTICTTQSFSNPSPPFIEYSRGEVAEGDSYEIGTGNDENGFGDYWNKTITSMLVHDDRLYVSTGLNSAHGAQVWFTENGDSWFLADPAKANSFGNFHSDERYPGGFKPVSSSITDLVVFNGFIYAGGTGTSGEQGACSRMARLTENGWEMVVDRGKEGMNESGFGGGMDCNMWTGNWMPWSIIEFNEMLFVATQGLGGTRILFSPDGSPEEGTWFYSVGGDSGIPSGFDEKKNIGIFFLVMYQNIAANLFVFENELYAGLVTNFSPKLGVDQNQLNGASLWKTADGFTWEPVTVNGFADRHNVSFDSFVSYNGSFYIGATKASGDGPETIMPPEGAMLYRLVSKPKTPEPLFKMTGKYETVMPQSGDKTDIYYPEDAGESETFPVALLLQGARIDKSYYSEYSRQVAQYGFIVVVPNHIHMFSVPGIIEELGLFSEQQQIHDTLEFMSAENTDTSSPLYGKVDTETLVLLGHSYGAACVLGAVQGDCEFPLCSEGQSFEIPAQLKAAALGGINTRPYGNPFDWAIRDTYNKGIPLAFINGAEDENATYTVTKTSYDKIKYPPKALVLIKGANHYAMCDVNNPPGIEFPGPSPQKQDPVLSQEISIETSARWSALFLRAHALHDEEAFYYVYNYGKYLDKNVKIFSDSGL